MKQFYSDVLKEYNRLNEIYLKARDLVNRQRISTQLLEDVDQALNDTTVLSKKLQNAYKSFQFEEFKEYSSAIIELKRRTNSLCSLLKNVKEEIDNVLKYHQVMQQLQKTEKSIEDKYDAYLVKMEGILQSFSAETTDAVQVTVENLKRELKEQTETKIDDTLKATEAFYNNKKDELEKELEETLNTRIEEFKKTVVQPMNKEIHSDLDKSIDMATVTIKAEFTETLGTERTEILNKFEADYKTKLDDFKSNELQTALDDFKTNELQTAMHNFEKESLKPLEQRTLTNVLTIFGVFASFITIVMVLVGTASSWLNTTDISSAIIAFVVPSGIGVLIVGALTTFVRVIAGDSTEAEEFHWGNQFIKWAPWLIVSAVCLILIGITINHGYNVEKDRIAQEAVKEPSHKIFVYNLSDCLHEEDGVTKADGTKEIKQYVEISYFKNKSDEYVTERKEYDEYESFIHDGRLFYCVLHDCFE